MQELHEKVLFTQVRVRGPKGGGSGTVIYAEKPDGKGFHSTYIITCHHVIAEALKIETKWDPLLAQDRKRDVRQSVTVEFFNWKAVPHGRAPLTSGSTADISSYDEDHDMALLHLQLADKPAVAKLLAPERIEELVIGTGVLAVGCALLHDPIITKGIVTHQGDVIDLKDFWMSSAQTIFGNSGGAVFTADSLEFIGIPSRVDVIGWGTAVTHLGYFSPITRVYEFFREQMYDFLVPGSGKTEKQCAAEREERRRQAESQRARDLIQAAMTAHPTKSEEALPTNQPY